MFTLIFQDNLAKKVKRSKNTKNSRKVTKSNKTCVVPYKARPMSLYKSFYKYVFVYHGSCPKDTRSRLATYPLEKTKVSQNYKLRKYNI